jgi:hypothetical protein
VDVDKLIRGLGSLGSGLHRSVRRHRADLLAYVLIGCWSYLSFNALSEYTDMHGLFPRPWGGRAMAVAVDGTVLYAYLSFRRGQWLRNIMAGVLLCFGATTTYLFQRWHAEVIGGNPSEMHPLIIAGVVPAAVVLVTFAWHLIRYEPTEPAAPAPGDSSSPRTAMPEVEPQAPKVQERERGVLTGRALVEHIIRAEGDPGTSELVRRAGVTDRTVRTARANVRANGSHL